jgi:hypothetical protein
MSIRINDTPIRFSSAVPVRSLALLGKNTKLILKDYAYGKIHNIDNVKTNAFILSSLIQVISRILVANNTAKKTENTPEGPFRYMEAVKTTFREALGFTLSYGVLRAFQRATIDFFRNYLWIRDGLSSDPTGINKIFKRMFNVPDNIAIRYNRKLFPNLGQTLSRLFTEVFNFSRKAQNKIELTAIDRLFPDVIKNRGVIMDTRRMAQFKRIEPLVNWVVRLAGKNPKALLRPHKLQLFFEWLPPLVGSLPALLLSGFLLERFSQNHAESLARKIARSLNESKAKPITMLNSTASMLNFNRDLDPSAILPYASEQSVPVTHPGVQFNGYTVSPGIRPYAAQQASIHANSYGSRPGSPPQN